MFFLNNLICITFNYKLFGLKNMEIIMTIAEQENVDFWFLNVLNFKNFTLSTTRNSQHGPLNI